MLKSKFRFLVSIMLTFMLIFSMSFLQGPLGNFAVMNAYADASGNVLMLAVRNQNADGAKYIRVAFSNTGYTIASGDYLEYDVKLAGLMYGAGGVDLKFSDGTYLCSPTQTGLRDQNGVPGIPNWNPPMKVGNAYTGV